MTHASPLFEPMTLGNIELKNRMVMAPLTRGRAGPTRIPNDMMAQYYAQRASAGLIISEATAISAQGYGWYGAPAMYTDAHEAGWKKVVDAVHERGGKIVLQLWHMGRVSHPEFLDGALPVAPSAIAAEGFAHAPSGKQPYVTPRALEASELPGIIETYVEGAKRAIRTGFDGVEIHAANSYLLDQFLRDSSNARTDEYGGSIQNRIRFPLQVVRAVVGAVGADKTGIRISPTNPYNGMSDSDPVGLFSAFAKALNEFDLAYLHVMEPITEGPRFNKDVYATPHIRDAYDGRIIVNGGYDAQTGADAIANKRIDAVAYGVPFLANPDLVERFKSGAPLNAPQQESFYSGGAEGYIDYPDLKQTKAA